MTENKESSKLSHLWFFLIQKTIDNQYQLCEKGEPDVQGLSDRKVYFFYIKELLLKSNLKDICGINSFI